MFSRKEKESLNTTAFGGEEPAEGLYRGQTVLEERRKPIFVCNRGSRFENHLLMVVAKREEKGTQHHGGWRERVVYYPRIKTPLPEPYSLKKV